MTFTLTTKVGYRYRGFWLPRSTKAAILGCCYHCLLISVRFSYWSVLCCCVTLISRWLSNLRFKRKLQSAVVQKSAVLWRCYISVSILSFRQYHVCVNGYNFLPADKSLPGFRFIAILKIPNYYYGYHLFRLVNNNPRLLDNSLKRAKTWSTEWDGTWACPPNVYTRLCM